MTVALFAATAAWPCAAEEPALADLSARYEGENLVVSVRLVEGLSPERLEEIESGIESVLEYRLQIQRRRPGLPDDVLARRRVECIVRRDALSRQYTLTRRVDGELMERRVTADPDEMRAFLTRIEQLPVASRAELMPADDLEVRARCDLGLMWRFYLIPWRMTTRWARVAVPAVPTGEPAEGGRGRRP